MSDAPPQLGSLPQHSDLNVPTLSSSNDNTNANGSAHVENAKNAILNNAQSAYNTVANHPVTQDLKNTVSSGPVAESVKDQHAKTTSELSNLAGARQTPGHKAATGQQLTHYHSFFWHLVTWEEPRATAIAFASTIALIFVARYVPVIRLAAKGTSYLLGVVALIELAGKLVLSQGLMANFRPKRYFTIPRESLEATLGDVEELINFFVIETQRIIFVENVAVTSVAFFVAFISYWLIKFVPLWGLALIGTSVMYLTPLIYLNNKQLIDSHLEHATNVVGSQAAQVRSLAGEHAGKATETIKGYAGDYTNKAQSMIGNATGRTSPEAGLKSGPGDAPKYKSSDFPHAPKQEPTPGVTSHEEQYENSQFGGQAEAAQ